MDKDFNSVAAPLGGFLFSASLWSIYCWLPTSRDGHVLWFFL